MLSARDLRQRKLLALYVSALVLAIAIASTTPFVGMLLLDSNAPRWSIKLYSFVLQVGFAGILFSAISFVSYPLLLCGLWLVGSSVRAKVSDYALACMFGCSLGISFCAVSSNFGANRHPTGFLHTSFERAMQSAELSPRKTLDPHEFWKQLTSLRESGELLVSSEYFVNNFSDFVMPGLLLPPMLLYIWKRRRKLKPSTEKIWLLDNSPGV